jgi:MFS family permease
MEQYRGWRKQKSVNRLKPLWVIYVTHMFVEVYYLTQVALIPVFIEEFKLSLLEASFVATIPGLVQLLANLPSGFMAERFNTKQLLFVSMAAEGFSALIVSQAGNFWILIVGVSIMRLCSPIYHISGLSRISRIVEREKINRSMGFHNALGSFGSAIGLIVLSIFQSTIGWRWIYIFWAIPILVWGFIVLKFVKLEESSEKIGYKKESKSNLISVLSKSFIIFLIAIALREVGSSGAQTYITVYLVEMRALSKSEASLIFGLSTFMGIFGSLNGGFIGEKIGAKKALSLCIVCSIISLSALGLSTHFPLLFSTYIFYMFFSSGVWSPINSIVADITPKNGKGFSYSIYFFTEGLIVSITPTIAATVIELSTIWFIFPFSISFLTIGLIVLQFLSYSGQQRKKPFEQ